MQTTSKYKNHVRSKEKEITQKTHRALGEQDRLIETIAEEDHHWGECLIEVGRVGENEEYP